jgi:hypothetical protein
LVGLELHQIPAMTNTLYRVKLGADNPAYGRWGAASRLVAHGKAARHDAGVAILSEPQELPGVFAECCELIAAVVGG